MIGWKLKLVGMLLLLPACEEASSPPAADRPDPAAAPAGSTSSFNVVWEAESKCDNPAVNGFVAEAVRRCAARDYEGYRMLWRYDHRPTSRKRFSRIWSAVEQVEVKLVKELRFRNEGPDDDLQSARKMYVFHAFVQVKSEVSQNYTGKVEDRDLVLLIVEQEDGWALVPAPSEVKQLIVQRAASRTLVTTPEVPTSRPVESSSPSD